MNDFAYAAPASVKEAVGLLSDSWGKTEVLAGGTDLVTCLKQHLTAPERVVSLRNCAELKGISAQNGKLVIGAMTPLKDLISNAEVQKNFPALVTVSRNIAAPQMLSMGTVGGELLQRPRCWYFRQGFGLLAMHDGKSLVPTGDNRYHAIFGNSGPAYFVSASSLAPVFVVLDAVAEVHGAGGPREVPLAELFKTPQSAEERENALKPNEILASIHVPVKGLKNGAYEIRPRTGLDWPNVAAAVAYEDNGGKAANAKVVLGHVAPVPWLSKEASAAINGQAINEQTAAKAGDAAKQGANPLSMNGYKVHQVKVAVKRALMASQA